jgi:hypothetical protein
MQRIKSLAIPLLMCFISIPLIIYISSDSYFGIVFLLFSLSTLIASLSRPVGEKSFIGDLIYSLVDPYNFLIIIFGKNHLIDKIFLILFFVTCTIKLELSIVVILLYILTLLYIKVKKIKTK